MQQDDSDKLSPPLESVLRAAFLDSQIPVTPAEVARRDASAKASPTSALLPPANPSPLFSWEKKAERKLADIVPFPSAAASDALAYAARARSGISAETRAKLSQLVRDMKSGNGDETRQS